VRRGAGWSVAHDHCPGPRFEGIADLVFSADGEHLAYLAESVRTWRVVVDGALGPAHPSVFAGTLRLSARGEHAAYVASEAQGARVVADGAPGPLVDGVSQLQLLPGGQPAYVARRGTSSFVMLGSTAGPAYGRVGRLVLGAEGLASYVAKRAGRWRVVWRGEELDSVELGASELPPELASSEDRRHVAWLAQGPAGASVWLDGEPFAGPYAGARAEGLTFAPGQSLPSFVLASADGRRHAVIASHAGPVLDRIGPLVFSADGRHFGYRGQRGVAHLLVIDGSEALLSLPPSDPVFSPDGQRVAYVLGAQPARVRVDGREYPFDVILGDTLRFSRDGQHWAVLAGDARRRRLEFIVDGRAALELDFAELISWLAQAEDREDPSAGSARSSAARADGAEFAPGSHSSAAVLRAWTEAVATSHSRTASSPAWLAGKCVAAGATTQSGAREH